MAAAVHERASRRGNRPLPPSVLADVEVKQPLRTASRRVEVLAAVRTLQRRLPGDAPKEGSRAVDGV